MLVPKKVKIPYAENIHSHFPAGHTIVRSMFPRFLDWIKASACIHQFNRKVDADDMTILANGFDYEYARTCFQSTISTDTLVPIMNIQKKIMEYLKPFKKEPFAVADASEKIKGFCSDRILRRHLDKLTEIGLLEKDQVKPEGGRPTFIWKLKEDVSNFIIPSWDEISKKV
jgi:predicted transcriptional regulator